MLFISLEVYPCGYIKQEGKTSFYEFADLATGLPVSERPRPGGRVQAWGGGPSGTPAIYPRASLFRPRPSVGGGRREEDRGIDPGRRPTSSYHRGVYVRTPRGGEGDGVRDSRER